MQEHGWWVVWGTYGGGAMFDGFMLNEPSGPGEADELIERIVAVDPQWGPLPNYDVEDPNDLNTSFILIVQNATEREVREEVAYFEPDARGYFRL